MLFSDRKEPLYARIKRELLSKIERGTWRLNHKLPSEEELQKQYNVSRGTVRRALSELELGGYISRVAGRGTFVTRVAPRLEKAVGEITSFTQQLSQAGFEPSTKVLFAGSIVPLKGWNLLPEHSEADIRETLVDMAMKMLNVRQG